MALRNLRDWPTNRRNLAALVVVLAICLSGIVALGIEVQRRLDVLTRANSDSIQWALSQLEVELMRLKVQTASPQAGPDDLLLRFDIFYSRIRTVRESPLYADLRARPDFAQPLGRISAFLDRTAAAFDSHTAESDLPATLRHDLLALLPDARRMSLVGVDFFASQSDRQRDAVADTLRGLLWVTTGLVIALSTLLILLVRLHDHGRRQSEAIRMTSARLSTIVATSADAIVVADRDGRVVEFNPAAEAMFGCGRDEALSLQTPDFFPVVCPQTGAPGPGGGSGLAGGAPDSVYPRRIEVQARRRSGESFPVEVSVASAESRNGEIVIGFLRDISDRQQAERDLTEARDKALAGEQAKARFLAVMSHEMRTPLNGLLGSAEILHATPLDPDQARLVGVIETSAQVLLDHVNAGLEISRIEAGAIWTQVTGFSMTTLVAEVVANQSGLAAAAGNRISVVTLGDLPGRILGNPGQVRQVLLNLVGNAVKFTSDGQISIEIDAGPLRGDMVEIELRVIDNGIGIAEDDLGRVFDDYVTLDTSYHRPTGGTGLGLGITQRLVRALGGEIGVESTPGAGSVFWVRLPFVTEPAAGTEALAEAVAAPSGLSVLVVDDNQINRFVLRSLLEEVGHRVTEAVDGPEGVGRAATEAHDLILMDISMPGMDGFEAARRIRAGDGRSRAARIVAVTAHALPADRLRLQEAGMQDCLIKPITRGSLSLLLSGGPAPSTQGGRTRPQSVDPAQIEDLAKRLEPAKLADLLGRFLDECDDTISRLGAGVPDVEARLLIHRLAGSAATFGATEFAERLQQAEAALAADPPDHEGAHALAGYWQLARDSLAEALQPHGRAAE
jgi:signal transduction histidine kinase/CheY-like chemotaxis protein